MSGCESWLFPYVKTTNPLRHPARAERLVGGALLALVVLMAAAVPVATLAVYSDARGQTPPWPGLDLVMVPAGVAIGGVLATFLATWATACWFRAWVLRRRTRLWGEEWARIGPLWTRHQDQP